MTPILTIDPYISLFIYTLSVYGISWIIVWGKIFENIREKLSKYTFLEGLLSCIVCTSVWVSVIIGLISKYTTILSHNVVIQNPLDAIILAGYSAATTWIIASLLDDLE